MLRSMPKEESYDGSSFLFRFRQELNHSQNKNFRVFFSF